MTSAHTWVYDNTGTWAVRSIACYHPSSQGDLSPLGTYGTGTGESVPGKRATLLVGPNPNTKPSQAAVARPTDYTLAYNDQGSQGEHDGSFWHPVAPEGYVALGDVVVGGYHKPATDIIWCVREDLVGYGKFLAASFWDDSRSGASMNASCWDILPESVGIDGSANIPVSAGTFYTNSNYERPTSTLARVLVLPVGKDYTTFDAPMPKFTADKIPNKGDQFDFTEQCFVTLPFHCFFPPTDQSSLDNIRDPFCSISRSVAWYVEGLWVNGAAGQLHRSSRVLCGVSREKSESMTNSIGVEISSTVGIELASARISLNYQFTYNTSSSFTEYSEKEVTDEFEVPDYHARFLLSKHIWIKGFRSNGSVPLKQLEVVATDAVYYTGCDLPH